MEYFSLLQQLLINDFQSRTAARITVRNHAALDEEAGAIAAPISRFLWARLISL
jgi:hypothetical protein